MKYYIIIYLLPIFSCSAKMSKSKINHEISIQKFIKNNFAEYQNIYDSLITDIEFRKNNLNSSISLQLFRKYQVDKLIIFNNNKTKLFTTLNTLTRVTDKGSSDRVQSLYGVKINNKWHVYLGAQNLIAMRDGYKYDKYEPFNWDELSYVAHEQMFDRYLNYSSGVLKKNEKQLETDTGIRALTGKNPDEVPSEEFAFLELSDYYNSKKIDSIEYQQLLDDVNNPEPKVKDPIVRLTWWDKLWGAEEPIFETDEWKEYIKNKNR